MPADCQARPLDVRNAQVHIGDMNFHASMMLNRDPEAWEGRGNMERSPMRMKALGLEEWQTVEMREQWEKLGLQLPTLFLVPAQRPLSPLSH